MLLVLWARLNVLGNVLLLTVNKDPVPALEAFEERDCCAVRGGDGEGMYEGFCIDFVGGVAGGVCVMNMATDDCDSEVPFTNALRESARINMEHGRRGYTVYTMHSMWGYMESIES